MSGHRKKKEILSADFLDLLNHRVEKYNNAGFVSGDPVSIPHLFSSPENIAIAGFLTATLSWGQRNQIIKNARQLMTLMENDPYDFLLHAGKKDLGKFTHYYYRTFDADDARYFIQQLMAIYRNNGSLRQIFEEGYLKHGSIRESILHFRDVFFGDGHPGRSAKHISDPSKGSSAKRLNMYLRWMVRSDGHRVDFGLWKGIPPSALLIPLDVHTGNTARKLGLLNRKTNDWKAVEELTAMLRQLDPVDPVKYDFALFGLGIFEKF